MKKYLIVLFILFIPGIIHAGEWVAVDNGAVEIDLTDGRLENKLWLYINKVSTIKFEPKEKYTFQYKAINNEEIFINALCDTFDRKELHKEVIVVFDGGSCFFQIQYNQKTGNFSKLRVNGEA